jgi:hypothetical protein
MEQPNVGVFRAVMRYLYGTDARTSHQSSRAESDAKFGDALRQIEAMQASTDRLKSLPPPAKSLDDALEQMMVRSREGRR